MSRILANGLSKRLGQPIVIEAKPGSGGNLAAAAIAKAEPDGYTIGLVTGAHAISGALYKSLPYDSVDSFEMISTLVYYALVIAVHRGWPVWIEVSMAGMAIYIACLLLTRPHRSVHDVAAEPQRAIA